MEVNKKMARTTRVYLSRGKYSALIHTVTHDLQREVLRINSKRVKQNHQNENKTGGSHISDIPSSHSFDSYVRGWCIYQLRDRFAHQVAERYVV
jgi:hypothetical protein